MLRFLGLCANKLLAHDTVVDAETEIRNKLKQTNAAPHNCSCKDVKINNKGILLV